MTVQIDPERFALAHAKFQKWMVEKSGGVPFTGFDHPFLIQDEIRYKWRVIDRATDALRLNRWNKWRRSPGTILEAVKSACAPAVSANLLEHRWPDRAPQAALTRVQPQDVGTLEKALCRFFEPGPFDRASFGRGFDNLAETLRRLRLGCQWPFLAYLAFLAHPHICFPMRSTRFERLLRFYGNDLRISGTVNWDRYQCLLDLANLLRERLSVYGRGTAIEIQSYMWVVAYLIGQGPNDEAEDTSVDLQAELERRRRSAAERERIGLLGEIHVYNAEKARLRGLGFPELSARVRLVSVTLPDAGYDVLSFEADGSEKHIEVKATLRSRSNDTGFWLSENERQQGSRDPCWTVFRIWEADTAPNFENLGNFLQDNSGNWQINASTWWVSPAAT